MNSTYSFADVSSTLAHPAVGSYTFQGAGLGGVTVAMANDVSQQDLAADGSVMTSKIKAQNGTLTYNLQQTSDGAKFLKKLNTYLKTAPSSEWTRATATVVSTQQGVNISATGLSPQKPPDAAFAQTGTQVAFAYLAQVITGV